MTAADNHDTAVSTPRTRRRAQTETEILDAALEVMAEEGVAGLNLTKVAARVGLRQPSLYQYFPSREAVYDRLFERGMHEHLQLISTAIEAAPSPGWPAARASAHATLRFTARKPVLAQLLFRPAVPGFAPSTRAYAPSLGVQQRVSQALRRAVELGELHPAAADVRGLKLFVSLVAGIASQRAANEPALRSEKHLHALMDPALDMYVEYLTPAKPTAWTPWPTRSAATTKRATSNTPRRYATQAQT